MALRILIADHRGDQVMPLVEFLLSRGLHAVICRSGGDAVDAIGLGLADAQPYDLVIAHIDLPEIAGLRVLYEARRLHLGTTAALICPRHRRDPKVERMIAKTGISSVLEPHVDLAQVDRLLKKVVVNRKAHAAQVQAKAAAKAKAEAQAQQRQARAQVPEATPRHATRPPIEAFHSAERHGASAVFFRPQDEREEDELPPIEGGGPPSAPTGIHQILPPIDEAGPPSPTMSAVLPPTSQPASGCFGATPPAAPAVPVTAAEDERQPRRPAAGAARRPAAPPRMVTAKCFRCGQIFKLKATGGVVSQPCLHCGQINDIRT